MIAENLFDNEANRQNQLIQILAHFTFHYCKHIIKASVKTNRP